MQKEEIEDILLCFAYKESDERAAQTAFSTLYHAYSKLLYHVLRKSLLGMGIMNEQLLTATVNNTFLKLYEDPLIFNFPEKTTSDGSFKGWLVQVSKNELLDLLKTHCDAKLSFEEEVKEPAFEDQDINEDAVESVNMGLLQNILATFPDRDREILMSLYQYHEEGKNTPSTILDILCKVHQTTRDNIRQIKKRSESKIIAHFMKNSQLKPLKNVK